MPAGSILDAGAHMGRWACYYAGAAPERRVWALEPVATNIEHMRRTYTDTNHPNLQPLLGALGNRPRMVDSGWRPPHIRTQLNGVQHMSGVSRGQVADAKRNVFEVFRLDDLFNSSAGGAMSSTQLGFAHLDLEGLAESSNRTQLPYKSRTRGTNRLPRVRFSSELSALRGGVHTLATHRPVFTVELHVHQHPAFTQNLLRFIAAQGYDAFLIEEPCGTRADCRNLLSIPRPASRFHGSAALDLATATRRLVAVDNTTIASHAYPCCMRGGECCRPATPGGCCSLKAVNAWLEGTLSAFNWTGHGVNRGIISGGSRDPRLFAPPIYMKQTEFAWPGPAPAAQARPLKVE